MRKIFVTGIGTDVGKTIVSAILVEALQADYFKPVQAGEENQDRMTVKSLVSAKRVKFHKEKFLLKNPMSPHAAAELEGIELRLSRLKLPSFNNNIIIEGAGGVMVPINYKGDTMLDLMKYYEAEVVLVCSNYLGSINHTLLSINALKSKDLNILGVFFNGESNPQSERVILETTGVRCLGRIKREEAFTKAIVKEYASDYVFI
ncbi:MAG: dethiobiotin synthase [Bacteroidetes bacterium]|nr:dethiobiotin synthase [Bacteroidota bacterium]